MTPYYYPAIAVCWATDTWFQVKRIIVNNFHGILLRYQNDIAIIEMDTKIIFNPFVIPSCLYYSKNSLIPIGNHLKVAGWGRNEKGEPSALLKITELPVMGVSECISKAPPELVEYFSSDKFCVANSTGYKNKVHLSTYMLFVNW